MASTPHRYVVDERGNRIFVLVPIDEYERLVPLTPVSPSFWAAPTISELATEQGVAPIADPTALLGDFWPSEESVDEFLTARRAWQHIDESDRKSDQD
ncbi:MAG: hypothetical protein HYX51_11070 [Chloroflexi bacterium]|nr:hypothetical protein [Chloroflexota bacterium]